MVQSYHEILADLLNHMVYLPLVSCFSLQLLLHWFFMFTITWWCQTR